MTSTRKLSGLSDFARNQRGAVFPFVAIALVPILLAVGLSIDAARAYLVRERLSFAIDAAALAAARAVGTEYMQDDFDKYFEANFPPAFMDAEVDGPNLVLSANSEIISVDASATVNTTFMRLANFDTLTVSSAAEVTRDLTDIDIVLSIDMSGSMGWSVGGGGTRIAAARTAALDLVGNLYGLTTVENLNIGVVPWSHIVNVWEVGTVYTGSASVPESTFSHPLTGDSTSELWEPNNSPVQLMTEPTGDWAGCVYARYEDDGSTTNDADTDYGPGTYGDNQWRGWDPTIGEQNDECPGIRITPLQDNQSELEAAINGLTSPDGATNIAQGLAWAWRVLMPDAPYTDAESNPDPVPYRTIILLTDGEHCAREKDAYAGAFGTDCTEGGLDDRLREIASNVKAEGIQIITIQFANGGGDLQDLMQEVATGPDAPYYYYAPDGAALQTVFQSIATHLAKLHISK